MLELYQIGLALLFHVLDFTTGFIGALKQKVLHSAKMRDGLFKKVGFIFCYVVALLIDKFGGLVGLTVGVKVLPIIIAYAVLTELISITENISKINPDLVPEKLQSFLHIDVKGE